MSGVGCQYLLDGFPPVECERAAVVTVVTDRDMGQVVVGNFCQEHADLLHHHTHQVPCPPGVLEERPSWIVTRVQPGTGDTIFLTVGYPSPGEFAWTKYEHNVTVFDDTTELWTWTQLLDARGIEHTVEVKS